jgi:hypothetical protein
MLKCRKTDGLKHLAEEIMGQVATVLNAGGGNDEEQETAARSWAPALEKVGASV